MNMLIPKNKKNFLLLLAFLCLAPLATAYIFEYVFHKTPCHLCIYERYPYLFGFLLCSIGVFINSLKIQNIFLFIISVGFLVGLGISFYHLGVEEGLISLPQNCTPGQISQGSFEHMRNSLINTPIVRCDVPSVIIFGLSLTAYNALYLFCLILFNAFFLFRKQNG